jgi:uncharacterized membrane protein YccC
MNNDQQHLEELSEDLRPLLADLPRQLLPPRDLWPTIAQRLGHETGAPRFWSSGRVAVAALVSAALGSLLTVAVLRGPASSPESDVFMAQPVAVEAQWQLTESEYLRAKESLWVLVYSHRESLPADVFAVIEANLKILDRAIRDLRKAIERDPQNRRLEEQLIETQARSLKLLRRVANST